MFKQTLKSINMGGKFAAISLLIGGTALAQATVTETPEGAVVEAGGDAIIVPESGLTTQSSVGIVAEGSYPVLEQWENDESVAKTLISQGFSDVHILRKGPYMTVSAQREGEPIELLYSVANGSLVAVNGEELRQPGEGSSANDKLSTTTDETTTDEGMTDGNTTDEGAGDDGTDDGAGDGSTDDGMSDGSSDTGDTGGDSTDGSDSDGGADSSGADSSGGDADSGSDGGSNGGADSGSDGGSDGGESDSNG